MSSTSFSTAATILFGHPTAVTSSIIFESDTHVFTEPASGTAAIMHRDMLTPLADLLIALSKAQLELGAHIDEN
jgi:hypothetical protein